MRRLLLFVLFVLAACSPATDGVEVGRVVETAVVETATVMPPTATVVPTKTAVATVTAEPTATVVVVPTLVLSAEELDSALFEAIREDDHEYISQLLDSGADVNGTTANGLTPLLIAAIRGNGATIALLLEAGADETAVDAQGNNAWHHVVASGEVDAARLLVELEIDINARGSFYEFSPLLLAAREGDVAMAELLLAHGADITQGDAWNDTPLNIAAYFGQLEFVEYMVAQGVEINHVNTLDLTALNHAIDQKHNNIAIFLREAGGEVGKAES